MENYRVDIQKIKQALSKELPGESAQMKMAPISRPRFSDMPKDTNEIKKAAVLIPIFSNGNEDFLLLTVRSIYDGVHSGQVSFPGGKFNEEETDPHLVALREMQEEIGIDKNQVEILGSLTPLYIPVSKMHVQPVIGWLNSRDWQPAEYEVASILEVPLSELFDIQNRKSKPMNLSSAGTLDVPYFELQGHVVWGATAMMLSEFIDILREFNEFY